eukprot:759316-Hanusia_phi.AAC.1
MGVPGESYGARPPRATESPSPGTGFNGSPFEPLATVRLLWFLAAAERTVGRHCRASNYERRTRLSTDDDSVTDQSGPLGHGSAASDRMILVPDRTVSVSQAFSAHHRVTFRGPFGSSTAAVAALGPG